MCNKSFSLACEIQLQTFPFDNTCTPGALGTTLNQEDVSADLVNQGILPVRHGIGSGS